MASLRPASHHQPVCLNTQYHTIDTIHTITTIIIIINITSSSSSSSRRSSSRSSSSSSSSSIIIAIINIILTITTIIIITMFIQCLNEFVKGFVTRSVFGRRWYLSKSYY